MFEALDFENGVISNVLAQYRAPRFSDVPSREVILVDRKDQPSIRPGPIIAIARCQVPHHHAPERSVSSTSHDRGPKLRLAAHEAPFRADAEGAAMLGKLGFA